MVHNNEDEITLAELLNKIKDFIHYLVEKWKLLLLMSCIGVGVGIVYYYKQKPKYEAACTFVLEDKQSSVGGLSGLASQFGFDIGGAAGGSLFAGDNILEILKSKKVLKQVLLSNVSEEGKKDSTLADLYLSFTGAKNLWEKKRPELAGINFKKAGDSINIIQDSILNTIYQSIVKNNLVVDRTKKNGSIIKVQVTSENEHFARLMAARLVNEASKLYMNIKTSTALENINQMQHKSDSLLALLNNKSYVAASAQPLDANPGIVTARVPVEIASRDKTVIATLYTEVTKNLETSKMLLAQQTPVIQVIDKPDLTLGDNKKGLFLIIIISLFISNFIVISYLVIAYIYKRIFARTL